MDSTKSAACPLSYSVAKTMLAAGHPPAHVHTRIPCTVRQYEDRACLLPAGAAGKQGPTPNRARQPTRRPASCSELERQHGAAAGGLAGKDALWQVVLADAPRLDQPLEVALLDLRQGKAGVRTWLDGVWADHCLLAGGGEGAGAGA